MNRTADLVKCRKDSSMKSHILKGHSTFDGAGVKLTRVFSNNETSLTDPFLLFDHFGSDNPEDYIKGFPWHPHRGIETVTYMLGGVVEHGDNLGNAGTIGTGDIQWMTAGSGIIHQEMPKASNEKMHGLQLWVNLPAKDKMMEPRYRGILKNEVPLTTADGAEIRIIAGSFNGIRGPVRDLMTEVEYLDVKLEKGKSISHKTKRHHTSFFYLINGSAVFDTAEIDNNNLVLFHDEGEVTVLAQTDIQYIFVSGKQLNEPIAWGGPIVMNTNEELETAFRELDNGTFIKTRARS